MKITKAVEQEDRNFIRKKVIEHNASYIPDEVKHPIQQINFILRDDKENILGGITGTIFWYHLHIDFLWVDASIRGRGYGNKLLNDIEEFARENSCNLIQLDTFSFQAPDFYQKNGYEVAGVIEDHPVKELRQYYLLKRLI
ncbi:GNAT family N-acetyltransferase [Peribacillus deserti]|uniref:GNAT family N-acetyltransferase n=1 Tax=Peribacillus deserti TaxID=673318 RepID=A0A2N5M7M1_9BACI|nr:GNAT family N-acetyltransferase [Peribacillus deserti]PLT30332.1 GNAT family N-acetyltransferase [Peribacillus deserti]